MDGRGFIQRIRYRFLKKTDWFESRLFETAGWAMLALATSAVILACLAAQVSPYDEAIPLVCARFIELGAVPAIDFKSFYPPLYYYAIAEGFRLIGPSFLIPRIFSAILLVGIIAAAAYYFRIAFYHLRRLTPFIVLPAAIAAAGALDYAAWPGFALALLSLLIYLISGYATRRNWLWVATAGLMGGVSTLVRFNFGPYVLFVILADILLAELLLETISPVRIRWRRALRQAIFYGIPFGAINLAFYFAVYGGNAISTPLRIVAYSAHVMGSSWAFLRLRPDTMTLFCLLFPCGWIAARKIIQLDRLPGATIIPITAGIVLTGLALLFRARPSVALWFPCFSFVIVIAIDVFVFRLPRAALDLLLLFACMQHYFLTRADSAHAALFAPVVALSIPFLFASPAVKGNSPGSNRLALKGRVFLAILAATYVMADKIDLRANVGLARSAVRMLASGDLNPHIPDRRRLAPDPARADELHATDFVRRRTAPSTRIFVGVKNHSKAFTNDVLAYWLAERLPAVTYINLDSASASEESIQRDIVNQLQKTHTEWAILYDTDGAPTAPFDEHPPGPKMLDDFLTGHFQEAARFGRYSVMTRNQPLQGESLPPN
jgi:hypothetical protein